MDAHQKQLIDNSRVLLEQLTNGRVSLRVDDVNNRMVFVDKRPSFLAKPNESQDLTDVVRWLTKTDIGEDGSVRINIAAPHIFSMNEFDKLSNFMGKAAAMNLPKKRNGELKVKFDNYEHIGESFITSVFIKVFNELEAAQGDRIDSSDVKLPQIDVAKEQRARGDIPVLLIDGDNDPDAARALFVDYTKNN